MTELQAALGHIGAGDASPAIEIERLVGFCELTFEGAYDDPGVRLGDVERLATLAGRATSRSAFLADLVLDPPRSTSALAGPPHLDDDYLILSTIHSAKGGEWSDVYVIHATDGNIPSDMALGEPGGVDEERRLLYVALTRAKDRLTVSAPQRFYLARFGPGAAHGYAPLSRFLSSDVRELFEESAVDSERGVIGGVDGSDVVGADPVRDLLASLWA
jgi:DNA helicase-2/ATP-dependent DNA helicase PcrA